MALEDLLRDLRNPHEQRRSFGYTAFKFLTALDAERLSSTGKRRLAEYQRKFERIEPEPATGITSYSSGHLSRTPRPSICPISSGSKPSRSTIRMSAKGLTHLLEVRQN